MIVIPVFSHGIQNAFGLNNILIGMAQAGPPKSGCFEPQPAAEHLFELSAGQFVRFDSFIGFDNPGFFRFLLPNGLAHWQQDYTD